MSSLQKYRIFPQGFPQTSCQRVGKALEQAYMLPLGRVALSLLSLSENHPRERVFK